MCSSKTDWLDLHCKQGRIHNLAPFSQFQNLSYDPPMVVIAINQGETSDQMYIARIL